MPTLARHRLLLALAFLAFVSLGLPDGAPGIAWPFVQSTFRLPLDRLGTLLSCGVAGYLVSSFLAGSAVRRWGVGPLLVASTALVSASLVGYALTPSWGLMLGLAACVGLGSGAIDAAINTFAAAAFSPRVVTWLHACFGVGATLGPLVMTAAVTTPGSSWRWGYAALATALALMATAFLLTRRLWEVPAAAEDVAAPEPPATIGSTLRRPVVLLHLALFFVYTGVEMTTGQWLFSLLRSPGRGFSDAGAGWAVGGFWASLTVGRIVFGQLVSRAKPLTILRCVFAVAPVAAALLCWRTAPWAAVAGACLMGFVLAPVYPLLISVTPARVGRRYAAHAVGFQVSAATVGIAALPYTAGLLADPGRIGIEVIGPFLLVGTIALVVIHEAVVRVAAVAEVERGFEVGKLSS